MTTFQQALLRAKMNERRRQKKKLFRVIDKRQIPSEKERIRKVKKKHGGFDDSWIDKEGLKNLSDTHTCFFCKKRMKPIISEVNTKGKIIMTCDTPECPGNYGEKRSSYPKPIRDLFVKYIDSKLNFDLNHLLVMRDPSRLWATRKRTI